MKEVIYYWLFLLLVGFLAYPKASYFFRNYPDKGYILSKILGWVMLGYLIWILVILGLFEFDVLVIIISMFLILIIPPISPLEYLWKPVEECNFHKIFTAFRERWFILFSIEICFLCLLSIYALLRSFQPDIFGAEKLMDYAFLNIIVKTNHFPPPDPWFAGGFINYYYFGYYLCAIPIKFMSIPVGIGYNLSVAMIAALTFMSSMIVCYRLAGRLVYAIVGSLTLSVLGNYDAIIQILSGNELGSINIWQSSRVIEKTINEFPAFSFLFADLHGHVMSLPIVILLIGLVIAVQEPVDVLSKPGDAKYRTVLIYMLSSILLGCLLMTNIWDFPIYSVFLFLVLVLWDDYSDSIIQSLPKHPVIEWSQGFLVKVVLWLVMIFISLLSAMPFLLYYEGQQKGLDIVKDRSQIGEFLIHYGILVIPLIIYLIVRYHGIVITTIRHKDIDSKKILTIAFILIFIYVMLKSIVLMFLFLLTIGLFFLILNSQHSRYIIVEVILLSGIGLLLTCEVLYIKDFYGSQPRMNTVFKLGYQAWILLSIGIAPILSITASSMKESRNWKWVRKYLIVLVISYLPLTAFPLFGTYNHSSHFKNKPCLDGTKHIRDHHPNDAQAIEWLKKQQGIQVILEAPGDSYQFHSIYSTFSGNTTLVGWQQHEALWRDWSWQLVRERTAMADIIYEGENKSVIRALLKQFNIYYIMFGPHERKKYGVESLAWLSATFPKVFSNEDVIIFKVT